MAQPPTRSTFFDEAEEPELGEKQKSRSRRSSFRKTISLITESRRSLDIGNSPQSPTSPRHRRSFSFHKRASSSATSVAEYPSSPSQYYNDPDARMKLKMVVASPESFDQALEHGFPSTTKLDAIGGSHEAELSLSRGRAHTTGSTQAPQIPPYQIKSSTFFDTSSVDSEEDDIEEDDSDDRREQLVLSRRNVSEQRRPFEYQSYPTDHNIESDGNDDESISDNDSPATPHFGEATSRIASPVRPELYLDNDAHAPFGGAQFSEHQNWDSGPWPTGPREMTLRMTLTKPELRSPEEQLYGWQGPSTRDPLALPKMRDHGEAEPTAQPNHKTLRSQSKPLDSHPLTSNIPAKSPKSESKKPKPQSKKSPPETRIPSSPPSSGKVRGLWRKVKERKG